MAVKTTAIAFRWTLMAWHLLLSLHLHSMLLQIPRNSKTVAQNEKEIIEAYALS
jgi:hypothetical protein